MSKDNELAVTPPAEWRKPRIEGKVTQLEATGRVVRWRPVDLLDLLAEGDIPDILTPEVMRVTWADAKDERGDQEKAKDWVSLLNLVTRLALIEPVIREEPSGDGVPARKDDELAPQDLLRAERVEIFYMATSPAKALFPFRAKQTGDVASIPQGNADRDAAA